MNVKKLFCNLICAPNQRDFVRIDRIKGETVVEVTYAISEQFVDIFFGSCQDVRVFGAYLLDYEYGCGKLKRANCTAVEFMRILGGLSEIPFNFRPLIFEKDSDLFNVNLQRVDITANQMENSSSINQLTAIFNKKKDSWPRAVMNDTGYRCDQAPPNMSPCKCDHCSRMCPAHLVKTTHPIVTITSGSSNNHHHHSSIHHSKIDSDAHHYEIHPVNPYSSSSSSSLSTICTIIISLWLKVLLMNYL